MNAFKKKYYRLDVNVGRVELLNCEELFVQEDILCLKLREQFVDYENQVSLAMIPFYAERILHLDKRIEEERNKRDKANHDEMQFLKRTLTDLSNSLAKEKKDVEQKA